jgi:phosphatidylserine/phosphatidylglycerophosphate/cardiolipin synthase-like enzyme
VSSLAEAIAATVETLAAAHLDALAAAYRTLGGYTQEGAAKARASVPAPQRDEVQRINDRWAARPDTAGAAIAIAFDAARSARRRARGPQVDVVATGPASAHVPVRLTSEVVVQLINGATHRLTLVSYAAYQIPAVVAALKAAVARGVQIGLILESPENLEGGGGAHAYSAFDLYHWPLDRRDPPNAKLHAKAIIVDSRDVLLTSANMTNAAYDKNIELGLFCRGGGVAARIQRHFDGLISGGVLVLAT